MARNEHNFDPANRELCSDGSCIGVVGPDGRCKECGRPGTSTTVHPRQRGLIPEQDANEQRDENRIRGAIPEPPPEFDDRQLCSDGSCIGIIGQDGRCRECGLALAD